MKIIKKELAGCQIEFSIEQPYAELQPDLAEAAKKLSQKINFPGFRPGHVPYGILKQKVDEAAILEEATELVIRRVLKKILEENKEEFISQPRINIEKIAPGNPLLFKIILVRLPKVKLGDYKKLKTQKSKLKVEEEEINEELEALRKIRASEKLVLREAKNGDKVEIDFTLRGEKIKNYSFILGERQVIPEFEKQVLGMKTNEEKKFKLTYPAGKEADVKLKLLNVYEVILPELNDEFAKTWNSENLEKLKEQIKERISFWKKQREEERWQNAVLEEITQQAEFEEIPEELRTNEKERMLIELKKSVEDSGGQWLDYLQHLKKTEEELKKSWDEVALRRIKFALVSRELIKQEGLEKNPEKLFAVLEKYTTMEA